MGVFRPPCFLLKYVLNFTKKKKKIIVRSFRRGLRCAIFEKQKKVWVKKCYPHEAYAGPDTPKGPLGEGVERIPGIKGLLAT